MNTPEAILRSEPNYKPNAWQAYTLAELGQWVHLLAMRASHRSDPTKARADLDAARAYHAMMAAHLDEVAAGL